MPLCFFFFFLISGVTKDVSEPFTSENTLNYVPGLLWKMGERKCICLFLIIIVAISKRALECFNIDHSSPWLPLKISENLKQGYEKKQVFSQTASGTLNPANETLCNSGMAKV